MDMTPVGDVDARLPQPAAGPGGGRRRAGGEAWLERLDDAKPFIEPWLSHQRRDAYWRQGSACEDYGAIRCPVFAVGGWSDGYRDMVFRIVEHVGGAGARADRPVGPHQSRETGRPGPAIGFLQECVRFFAASLDGADNGFFDEPRLISYMQEPVAPAGSYAERPGRWVADPSWPSPAVARVDARGRARARLHEPARPPRRRPPAACAGCRRTGVDGGVWCGDGSPADFALDQRPDDGASLCWDSAPLTERVELLGTGEAQLELSVDRPWALVAVRVCDVAPGRALDAGRARPAQPEPPGGPRPQRPDARRRAGATSASRCSRRRTRSRPDIGSGSRCPTRTGRWPGRLRSRSR